MARTYVKIDDDMNHNEKVRGVSLSSRWAYVASICHSGRTLSDGFIRKGDLGLVDATPKIAKELETAGLWERVDAGWVVHDYLEHNRSREQVEILRKKNAANGAVGLANRYATRNTNGKANRLASAISATAATSPSTGSLGEISLEENMQQQQKASSESLGQTPPSLEDADYRRILDTWLSETGTTLPRGPSERFEAYALDLNVGWVLDAIRETGSAGVKRPQYTFAILDRWKMDGREVKPETADATAKFKNDRVLAAQVAWKERNG